MGVDTTITTGVWTAHPDVWPPPFEDAEPLINLPREAQLDITSLASAEMIAVRNTLTGEFECHYQMWLISMMSLHLNLFEVQDQPGNNWELTD